MEATDPKAVAEHRDFGAGQALDQAAPEEPFSFSACGRTFVVHRPLPPGALVDVMKWANRKALSELEVVAAFASFFERVLGETQYSVFLDIMGELSQEQMTDIAGYVMERGSENRPLVLRSPLPPPSSTPSSGGSSTAGAAPDASSGETSA